MKVSRITRDDARIPKIRTKCPCMLSMWTVSQDKKRTFKDLEAGEESSLYLRQRDNGLKSKLRDNLEGVLKWLVCGAVKWYASRDLKKRAPEKVKEFSRSYFEEQDKVACFIKNECETGAEYSVSTSDFTYELNDWLSADNHPRVSAKSLSATMQRKGFPKKQVWTDKRNVMSFVGIRLKRGRTGEVFEEDNEI